MADESQTTIRGINWRETFPFTQIFKAFRVAIHPTKLILALAALLSLYLGGRVLDALWPVSSNAVVVRTYKPMSRMPVEETTEVDRFAGAQKNRGAATEPFSKTREGMRKEVEAGYTALLRDLKVEADEEKQKDAARTGSRLSEVKEKLLAAKADEIKRLTDDREKSIKAAAEAREQAIKDKKSTDAADNLRKSADATYDKGVIEIDNAIVDQYYTAKSIGGQGIFIQFFGYEVNQINNIVNGVISNDWLGGFNNTPSAQRNGAPGVLESIRNFAVTGPWWLISQHTFYFILFSILFSVIWAVFGGAISRIAAVHVARDEKISLSSALRFSTGKFLSFMFAPVIPLVIVLVVGLVVAVGGLIGNIPWVGPFLMGLFFFLALAAGFVMTLVLLGTAGGFSLMYPTIAVEGSDSFDAISRSFSYVYARPWRMLFYTLVAVVYGALCFMFVRFFLFLVLSLTHGFVDWGMMKNIDSTQPIDLWSRMWPAPTARFSYDIDTLNMHTDQVLGAFLISFWVYMAVGLLGAFFISFYFSSNTIIYYLMRREVDATELDDVYLEQSDEDFGDAAPPAVAATPTTTDALPPTNPAQATPPPAGG